MTYPFPGMNPFLEHRSVWHDFHQRFVPRIGDALAASIRPRYTTQIDENVYVHQLPPSDRALLGRPDVVVTRGNSPSSGTGGPATLEAPAEGLLLPTEDRISEPFIEIRDNESGEVITVIELLSPTNKRLGGDRDQYVAKRRVLLASSVHFVEIDLLRGGVRSDIEGLPNCDYCIMVSRARLRPRVGLWPLRLPDRLPIIPIPLGEGDADATLDLQELLIAQFEAAGYEDYIYRNIPQPPLHCDDAAWAESLLS